MSPPVENDDRLVGRIWSRREIIALFGAAGAAALLGPYTRSAAALSADPICVVTPEQTEGPFFVDEPLNRSDIRSDTHSGARKEGIPFELQLNVLQINDGRCVPIPGARVDIWHCDALGIYSDVSDSGRKAAKQNFLRGYQLTDQTGSVTFSTICPGWYEYRTVHIHLKIRSRPINGRSKEFVSQLYFDDRFNDMVNAQFPYSSRGHRKLMNADDEIFSDGGSQLLLAPVAAKSGYKAAFSIGLV